MSWTDVSADPVDFDEAIEQFRKLVPVTDDDYERLTARAKRKAFKVAGVANLDTVQDVFDAIDDAIANGTDLDDFKDAVGEALESAWHGDVENPGWRLETIFRTNVQRAYGEGRYRQATDPDVLEDRPYWQFDAVLDDATTEVCEYCNGTVLPADDPWWDSHQPPLHFNCRSTFITLTEDQARQAGGVVDKPPKAEPMDGFGDPPLDDADDDQEQADFEPDLSAYDKGLAREFERQQEKAPPAPEPLRAKEGVHFEKVSRQRGLSDDEHAAGDAALAAMVDFGLLPHLEQFPLKELSLRKTLDKPQWDGVAHAASATVELRLSERAGWSGKKLDPGSTWRVADTAETWDDHVRHNLLHETAHHFHFRSFADTDPIIKRAYSGIESGARKPFTRYGAADRFEYFAETFSAHRVFPDELKQHDPTGFQMVEDVLQAWKTSKQK